MAMTPKEIAAYYMDVGSLITVKMIKESIADRKEDKIAYTDTLINATILLLEGRIGEKGVIDTNLSIMEAEYGDKK